VKSEVSIDVAAPPDIVFRLARDPRRWSTLLGHYAVSRRVGPPGADGSVIVVFVAVRRIALLPALGLPVAWAARTWSEPDARRLRFVHLGGPTRGMDVTWRIEERPGGCRVTIEHDFRAPAAWARFIDRCFTRPIAGRTLAAFRAIAEAAVESAGTGNESNASSTTNSPV
jgi:hypothetical protein